MHKNKHPRPTQTVRAKQLNEAQEIHQEADDEEPLNAVNILISEEESAPAKTMADRFNKFTCFLFGIIFCVMVLNLGKFLGYLPVLVKLEITMNWSRIQIPDVFKV